MAENVFAVSHTVQDGGPRTMATDETVYVSSGRLLEGVEARIEAGEIQLRSPSLFHGYWSSDGIRTDAFTSDGWFRTGDYGRITDGELYVIGRLKDIIIVGGQNVFPEDLEAIANSIPGLRAGRVVAFGVFDEERGTESIAIVGEMADEFDGSSRALLERSHATTPVGSSCRNG